jgi:phage virion morphogenesis protein
MGGFTVTVAATSVQDRLARLEAATGDLQPVFDDLGRMLRLRIQRQFEQESAPGGGKWTPLRPSTIARRATRGRWPGPMLRQTGDLYRSITYRATSKDLVLGTNWPYAAIHQFGGRAGRGGRTAIPARPYMLDASGNFPADWLGAVVRRLEQHLNMSAR